MSEKMSFNEIKELPGKELIKFKETNENELNKERINGLVLIATAVIMTLFAVELAIDEINKTSVSESIMRDVYKYLNGMILVGVTDSILIWNILKKIDLVAELDRRNGMAARRIKSLIIKGFNTEKKV